jgi:signal transduction histidine kinase
MECYTDIKPLLKELTPLTPECKIKHVGDLFLDPAYQNFLSLPVVENGVPVGTISRYQIMTIYIMHYGRELYGNKPLSTLMNPNPLVLEANTELELASEYITSNMKFPIMEDFIVVHHGLYYGVGVVMDVLKAITDLKYRAYDRALKDKVAQLKQRNLELAAKSEEAKAASTAKSQFLATMSHELRTPLNAILGYNELIEEELQDAGLTQYLPDLHKIHQSATHLLNIINDILDISKIEAGKMELHLSRFEIQPLLDKLKRMIAPQLEKNHNYMRLQAPQSLGEMTADMQKLTQALLNLLSNATKFSENSEILLQINPIIEEDEAWLMFCIYDHGIGMSAAQIETLFEPFTQADASYTRKYGGTGLGLAITKQIIELMGGTIDVSSEIGAGSCFTLYLPRHVSAKQNKHSKHKKFKKFTPILSPPSSVSISPLN